MKKWILTFRQECPQESYLKDTLQLLSTSIADPNYLGISLIFHPMPLDSETASVENIIRLIEMVSSFNIKIVNERAINAINEAKKPE